MSREAMKQALEALEGLQTWSNGWLKFTDEIQALRQALAQPEQEPVAWISEGGDVSRSKRYMDEMGFKCNPLYTAPPKKEWVGLTDDDVSYFRYQATFCDEFDAAFMAELIEKDLKEKNKW